MTLTSLIEDLGHQLPSHCLVTDPAELSMYDCDGLASYRVSTSTP